MFKSFRFIRFVEIIVNFFIEIALTYSIKARKKWVVS